MLERVTIISGESSGELYGALLYRTLKSRNPKIKITGVGGEQMQAAGVDLIARIASFFGLSESAKAYGRIKKTFDAVITSLQSFRPHVLVLIDYPDFNLRVARKAKKLGIPILYYVSPQVWAWRPARVKLIARLVEKIAVILPFEREIYRQAGVPCDFVGHPVIDEIREIMTRSGSGIDEIGAQSLKVAIRKEIGLDPARPVMTLMPGSRPHEIKALLPVMSEVIKSMRQQYPAYQFVIPLAPNLDEHKLAIFSVLNKKGDMSAHCRVIKGESVKALLCSDCAVIASGTSTFQASLLKVPFVVVYKVSPLTFFLGKRIVKVDHICLVNLLLNKSAEGNSGLYVKELMQEDVTGRNIMEEITKILEEPLYRSEMLLQFDRVRRLFIDKQASERVAEMIEAVAAAHSHSPVTL